MVKSILDEGTVALGTRMDFWKSLRRSQPWGNSRGSREEAVETGGWIQNVMEKITRKISAESQRVKGRQRPVPADGCGFRWHIFVQMDAKCAMCECRLHVFQRTLLFRDWRSLNRSELQLTDWVQLLRPSNESCGRRSFQPVSIIHTYPANLLAWYWRN